MIGKIIIGVLIGIPGIIIGYMAGQKHFPPISEIADVKTIQAVKPAWDIKVRYFCIGDCRDYSDDDSRGGSSRGGSSYGGGK